ncbi:hypothetical protein [Zobellia alginiliquefaciens]|uniref:hypothetical protein n=1 Tax=Zobellia alginiliquefaciens TaxID=3032586 RepID=UPI0023E3B728|nr:hypothetical protein [Zobellia alginiliquefaciens]
MEKETKAQGFNIKGSESGNVVLEGREGKYWLHNEAPVTILYKGKSKEFGADNRRSITIN